MTHFDFKYFSMPKKSNLLSTPKFSVQIRPQLADLAKNSPTKCPIFISNILYKPINSNLRPVNYLYDNLGNICHSTIYENGFMGEFSGQIC